MTCARLLEPLVHEPLVDVLEHDRQVGGGERLGDLAAHRAGADDGGLEYEHPCKTSESAREPRGGSLSVSAAPGAARGGSLP